MNFWVQWHTSNPGTWDVEAERPRVQGQPQLHRLWSQNGQHGPPCQKIKLTTTTNSCLFYGTVDRKLKPAGLDLTNYKQKETAPSQSWVHYRPSLTSPPWQLVSLRHSSCAAECYGVVLGEHSYCWLQNEELSFQESLDAKSHHKEFSVLTFIRIPQRCITSDGLWYNLTKQSVLANKIWPVLWNQTKLSK